MEPNKAIFQLKQYSVDYIKFNRNNNFVQKKEIPFTYNIKMNNSISMEQKEILTSIIIKVFDKTESYPYFIDVKITGLFTFEEADTNKNIIDHFSKINAPAIIYPYARSLIQSITAQAGGPTLTLPVVNIAETIKKTKGKRKS